MRPLFVPFVVLVALLAGCTSPSGGGGTGGGGYQGPPPETPVWMIGDSLAWRTAVDMNPQPNWAAAAGGAGFTTNPELPGGNISDLAMAAGVDAYRPDLAPALGGVNELAVGGDAIDVIVAMQDFESTLASFGVRVRWILEPTWGYAAAEQPIYDHLLSNTSDPIDCRHAAGPSLDGLHPLRWEPFAACIDAALAAP